MPTTIPSAAEFFHTPFTAMLDELANVLENKDQKMKALATFEDGYQVQRVLDAIRQSADQGTRVNILS